MNIGILGCSHSFGTGLDLSNTINSLYTKTGTLYQNLKDIGYSAILSKLYPQHNFDVIPALCAGNLDIIQNLVDCIENNPKDLYIVQTTQWHRFTYGVLAYDIDTISVSNNLTYTAYKINDLKSKGPNCFLSVLPHSIPGDTLGTGYGGFDFLNILDGNNVRKQAFLNAMQLLIYDHIGSTYHLNSNKKLFDELHYLSTQENIWYFHWDPPFGSEKDFLKLTEAESKEMQDKHLHAIKSIKSFYDIWNRKNHNKQIISYDIVNYFEKTFGFKKTISKYVTDGYHLNNDAHKIIVNLLLSNPKFKEALNG